MLFSVIIPTSNEERYIGKILESLKNQTFKDFEVVIVDAGSKDKTKKKSYEFKKFFKNFKFIVEKKKGISRARNIGAKASKGDILLFLDSDGFVDKDFLEKALKQIKERKLNTTGCYVRPITKNISIKIYFTLYNSWAWLAQYFYPHMAGFCIFSDRETFFKLNGFDEKIILAEDMDFVNRSKKIGKFRVLKGLRINTSMRRFEEEGILKMGAKYLLILFYRLFVGEIKTDIFHYKMGYHRK